MSQNFDNDFSAPTDLFAAAASAEERSRFIIKTYSYLAASVFALVGVEFLLFQLLPANDIGRLMMGSRWSWLIVLGLFMGVSSIANYWASSSTSSSLQHFGLGLYIVAEAFILLPLFCIALSYGDKGVQILQEASFVTLGLFALMTLAVFITRYDFSFMGTFLYFGGFAVLGLIVLSAVFGFSLPFFAIYALIALMCAWILYDTSNVLHHYMIGQHVAASLALFASLATLFFYVLQLFLSRND